MPVTDDRRSPDWDIRSGLGNLASLLGAQGLSTLAALTATWLVTKSLGSAGYGEVAAVIIATQILSFISVDWTGISLWRFGCEEFVESGRVAQTFRARLVLMLFSLTAVAALSPWILPLLGSFLKISTQQQPLVLVYLAVVVSWSHLQRTMQAVKLPRLQGALLAVERLVLVSTVGILWTFDRVTVNAVIAAYITAPLLSISVAIWQLRSLIKGGGSLDSRLLRKMVTFSLPLVPSSLAASLSAIQLDAMFITHYLSVSALGVYSIANQVASGVMLLPQHVGSLLLTFFVTSQTARQEELLSDYFREVLPALTIIWSAAAVTFACIGTVLVPWVFGSQFAHTGQLLWPLMTANALAGPVTMGYGLMSNVRSTTYMSTVAFGVSATLNVTLNWLLIPRFGLVGCAWATVIAAAANTSIWCLYAKRLTAVSPLTVIAALAAPVCATVAVLVTGDSVIGLTVAVVVSLPTAVPQFRTLIGRLRRTSESGAHVPPWLAGVLSKAGRP